MPRSSIEMKALIKTERQERIQERILNENQEMERKQKIKNLDRIKLSVNPLVRFFVLSKIK